MTSSFADIQKRLHECNPKTQILAVSKLQSVEKIRQLHSQGQRLFGENYVQEALDKLDQLKDLSDIQWHFIGRLQKNKVKFVVGHFHLIHSVDSFELAQVISRKAQETGGRQKILLQLNLADEASKGGFSEGILESSISDLASLSGIEICGLMTMPPLFENPEEARPFFKKLFNIRNQYSSRLPQLTHLSMGTSSDYLVAAEEGATLVRLGTILFGERPVK